MSYSRVKIAARLRPPLPAEQHDSAIRVVHTSSSPAIHVDNPRDTSQTFKYPFSSCYDAASQQHEIFDRDVQPLIELAFSGITVTVFAYGVTSSGKTHTMQGSSDQPGIIPRAVQEVFRKAGDTAQRAVVHASYMEIYKDEVYDLLVDRETANKLPVRENESGQVFVANLSLVTLETVDDFTALFSRANKQRSVGSTNLNSVSSRSHAILTLYITVTDTTRNLTLSGKLNLVDLAGSENNKHTGNDASRMVESAAINKSLSVLGQVVHALNQGASRIPYRNSKLTRILQDALGGSSVGLLICNLAPGTKFRQDTLNTLNFAVRTKNVQNKPAVNQSNAVAGPSKPQGVAAPLPNAAATVSALLRPALPRPSRMPRPSVVHAPSGRPSLTAASPPEPIAITKPAPTLPLHLTEDEINARIARAVELEVARRLEEREKQRLEEEEAAISTSTSRSSNTSSSLSNDGDDSSNANTSTSLQTLPSGLLTPLLKSRNTEDEELKRRLDELEARFERANKAVQLADVLSPLSRKKTGRAYVALARSESQKDNLKLALELYRKAQKYVPDNDKLRERIIEIQWAVDNNRPFKTSPKRTRRQPKREGSRSKSKRKPTRPLAPMTEEDEASEKENLDDAVKSSGKRQIPTTDAESDTPPKKRQMVDITEECVA
ncbi:kinesin-domain-containing protein [Epithele typhae]|uniref:kinesin-domain-containing protein n=1 Tax=Epithele typhae TaxID=378194 RepID=UPI0020074026|nr:kinesin-domain-containing protein [Epithele typhae]KAH9917698.1 kinesin-domain-containing protein [Epithele typhae]